MAINGGSFKLARPKTRISDGCGVWIAGACGIDQFFLLGASGNRGPSTRVEIIGSIHGRLLPKPNECIRAALANALYLLVGIEVAVGMLKLGPVYGKQLESARRMVGAQTGKILSPEAYGTVSNSIRGWILEHSDGYSYKS